MVMLHYTAMRTARAARDWLCDDRAEVSAHYVISERGEVWHLVHEADRAWHAGDGAWGAVEDVNSRSIGIELANTGDHPFAEPQMAALETLLDGIMARWNIPPERVIGHSCHAPGRKRDPGPRFDWARLAHEGRAIAIEGDPAEPDERRAEALMRRAGFTAPASFDERLAAFRLRHRPAASGPLDATDMGLIAALAERYPVDAAGAGA
ncbi:N-acetylmuramoyl-L-alanine amidase [Pseudaestuariivita atlantica]|uniref:N-acetylmuramoyl-L-alanine amidase n=2 Tax=Pseudaestuariivita atlantica TaxID=1317121 RepID=A0A0L1JLD3_9RHOB|nr:N-acetylmuramoyl-L-alanine amidase [Pseudaestuariivita atlantica]